jgi:hypothetical protein
LLPFAIYFIVVERGGVVTIGQVVNADIEMMGDPIVFPIEIITDIPAEIIRHTIIVWMGIIAPGRKRFIILVCGWHSEDKGRKRARLQALIVT